MAKGKPRPSGGRPPNRSGGGAGNGPLPHYRSGGTGGGTNHKGGDCCPMVAAVRAATHGRFRLAARYARLSGRLIVARVAWTA
jgi:hypothetical protein